MARSFIHPTFFVLCGIIAIILLGDTSYSYARYTLLACGTILLYVYPYKPRAARIIAVLLILMMVTHYRHCSIAKNFETQNKLLTAHPLDLTGRVVSLEKYKDQGNRYKLKLDTIELQNNSRSTIPPLFIYLRRKPNCTLGDTVSIAGLTISPCTKKSIKQYLIKENIGGIAFANNISMHTINPKKQRWSGFALFKERLAQDLFSKMDVTTRYFFSTLFLGKKCPGSFQRTMQRRYTHLGICHLLARSGIHVMSLVSFWALILTAVCIPLSFKHILIVAMLLFFYFMSWSSIPFVRALLGTFLCYACARYKLPIHSIHLIIVNTGLMLVYNPFYLFSLDFQLSYSLAITIAIYNRLKK